MNPFLWRAQADVEWNFDPTAVRRLSDTNYGGLETKLEEDVRHYERRLLDEAAARDLDRLGSRKLSELQTLARIRHFGGATRFMDFTRNPMTALWFACQGAMDKDAAIYALDTYGCVRVQGEVAEWSVEEFTEPEEYGNVVYYWRPSYTSDRMHAQQSVLVFSRLDKKGWSPLQVNGPDSGERAKRIYRITISSRLKSFLSGRWDQLFGYSQVAMYPDIEGFGTHHSVDAPMDGSRFSI